MRQKMQMCEDCGAKKPKSRLLHTSYKGNGERIKDESGTVMKKWVCMDCNRKDEYPLEVILSRSSWAPWGEQAVIRVGDLLHKELMKDQAKGARR